MTNAPNRRRRNEVRRAGRTAEKLRRARLDGAAPTTTPAERLQEEARRLREEAAGG